jgi:shikimate kinase
MNITLIGMPASGKSYVGRKVAEALNLSFIEIDALLEKRYQKPLQQILEELGDEAFIQQEAAITKEETEGKDNLLISTGGSIVYAKETMQYLKDISTVVYLQTSLETIEKRIRGDRGVVGLGSKTLQELYTERTALYERYADVALSGEQTPEELVKKIHKL